MKLPLLISLVTLLAAAATAPAAGARDVRVLATGDSMIEPLDELLAKRVAPARTGREARGGTGVSKIYPLDWVRHARKQVRSYSPRATVMWIGANDGAPLETDDGRSVKCCRAAWIEAYAERARKMMRTYTGDGRHVYWLTLPAPRSDARARIFAAVNAAIARAAEGVERARVLDMVAVLSPGFRYRRTAQVDGKRAVIRQRDGVHVSRAGAKLALRPLLRAMRADGVVD